MVCLPRRIDPVDVRILLARAERTLDDLAEAVYVGRRTAEAWVADSDVASSRRMPAAAYELALAKWGLVEIRTASKP